MLGDEEHRVDGEGEGGVAHKVGQGDARVPRAEHVVVLLLHQLGLYCDRGGLVDAEQTLRVRPRAHAAAAHLDAEEVVEEGDDKVVVQVEPRGRADREGEDGQPLGARTAQEDDARVPSPRRDARGVDLVVSPANGLCGDRLLELEHEA